MLFRDRRDAGQQLAGQLTVFAHRPEVIVLALPRGGVPVAYEVARALGAPLDLLSVRKLGAPGQPELALGAIALGGVQVLNPTFAHLGILPGQLESVIAREQIELERRELAYRGDRPPLAVQGRVVILIDDGLATGSTMSAAIAAVRQRQPAQIVVAVPVGARSVCDRLSQQADSVVCLHTPADLNSVGQWYADFTQTTDEEVRALLASAALHSVRA